MAPDTGTLIFEACEYVGAPRIQHNNSPSERGARTYLQAYTWQVVTVVTKVTKKKSQKTFFTKKTFFLIFTTNNFLFFTKKKTEMKLKKSNSDEIQEKKIVMKLKTKIVMRLNS